MTKVGLPAVVVEALVALLESLSVSLLLVLSSESRLKNRVIVLSDSLVLHIGNVGVECCSSSSSLSGCSMNLDFFWVTAGSEKSNEMAVSFFL